MYLNNISPNSKSIMDGNNDNRSISLLSPTSMMNTLSLQGDETFQNNLIEAMNPIENNITSVKRLSLADITVAEILKTYKHDTDLLKHILAAKTEEDKRKSAEELRRAEEARLQSKYIDLQLEQKRRSSLFDDASLGLSPNQNDWLSQINSTGLLSPSFLNNTPPSPYTLFDASISTELNLSTPSSPELNNPPALLVEKISLTDDPPPPPPPPATTSKQSDKQIESVPPPPPPPTNKEKASCKRTFSRTRSTRKPSVRVLAKKNRYLQQQNGDEGVEKGVISSKENEKGGQDETGEKQKDTSPPLDHDTVMEALRAKLKRSSQQLKEQKNSTKEEFASMSPTGILLLDLKNPKKSFPIRTPRVSVVRKPHSFISAHKPKETNVNS